MFTDNQLDEILPYLAQIEGIVIGLGFEPGRTEIRIRSEDGSTVTIGSTQEQVELALSLRENPVRALYVWNKANRLLRIEAHGEPLFVPTDGMIKAHIFDRWRDLLHKFGIEG